MQANSIDSRLIQSNVVNEHLSRTAGSTLSAQAYSDLVDVGKIDACSENSRRSMRHSA